MYVRLAFAVAINVEPDVLIVDEALSVGDAAFQMKCIDKINKMRDAGITLLFVSHDPGAVKRLCDRAILLEKGNLIKEGTPEVVFDLYNAMLADENLTNTIVREISSGKVQTVSGTGEAKVEEIVMLNSNNEHANIFEVGEEVTLRVKVKVYKDIERLVLGFQIKDRLGQIIFGTNTFHTRQVIEDVKEGSTIFFNIKFNMNLGPGDYSISTALVNSDTHLDKNFEWKDLAFIFRVTNVHKCIFAGFNWLQVHFIIER